MSLSHTQAVGFADDVCDLLQKEKAALTKAGLNVDLFLGVLKGLQDQVTTANANQESLKAQLKTVTEFYTGLKQNMYMTASGYLDTAMAGVGKGSIKAGIFRRLRSKVRERAPGEVDEAEPPAVEPNPDATA